MNKPKTAALEYSKWNAIETPRVEAISELPNKFHPKLRIFSDLDNQFRLGILPQQTNRFCVESLGDIESVESSKRLLALMRLVNQVFSVFSQ
jgi:hypothetical protein